MLEYINSKKILNYISKVLSIIILFSIFIYLFKQIMYIDDNINNYLEIQENRKMFAIYDEKMQKENEFYNMVINKEYVNQNSIVPYIPEGFSYVEGEWNTGFVIQDINQNQYVWVPCTNKENKDISKLERKNSSKKSLITKEICNNENYQEFLNSALENGGFYISRFEIGKENEKPVSKANTEILKDITRNEAIHIIDKMYDNINCELINGYAYDTVITWITTTNNIVTGNNINVKDEKIYTGRKNYNNIYDLFDNIMEMTLESSYDTVIIRGNIDTELIKEIDRFSILKQENTFAQTTILGFRTIIYK